MNWKKILLVLMVILGGGAILMVSISRASLEVVNRDLMEGKINVEIVKMGDRVIYRLPQSGMLPNNTLYVFKEMRNWFWEKFSFGEVRKSRILLLLADKKMAECRKLIEKGDQKRAFESGTEALNKLKYAYTTSLGIKNDSIGKGQILNQIADATLAYEVISQNINNKKIIENINDFKKEQIENKIYFQK